ncbi:MAG: hypothetical protein Q4F76_06775 [Lachnospiraceae bacterium]|nr:hypothetical protein [Lachnospiraceae bacterium]
MRRVKDNKYGYRSWSEEELKKFGKFLILPLVVIVLVLAILIVDRRKHPKPEETLVEERMTAGEENPDPSEESGSPDDGSGLEGTSAEGAEGQEEETAAAGEFTRDGVPQVQELMNRYFAAKQSADAEAIYQMFGWTDQTGIDNLRRQLQYDARYTEGYRNIACYMKPGLTEGTYLVYVSYDLKFNNSLTMAPGLLWNYVKMGEDGNYYLTDSETLDDVELAFIAESEKADEIVLLKTQIYAKLRLALENDTALAESYSILERQGGAAGTKQQETQHEVTVQIGQ